MNRTYEIVRGTIILLVVLALVGVVLMRWLKRSRDDPKVLIFKWIVTVPLVLLAFFSVAIAGIGGPFIIVFCGICLSILWTPNIGTWLIKPLTSAIDGGDEEAERRPFYSAARALRNRGKHLDAVAEVRKQLARFPNDFEGIMLLAALQAENLNDLPGAELTLNRFCDLPGQPSKWIAAAMYQLADWHLKYSLDPDAARRALETLVTRFPETELAAHAAQRIAHLASPEFLLAARDPETVELTPGVQDLGLRQKQEHLKPAETTPEQLAAEYVKQLDRHPLDTEAREKLALLYGEHYCRLDLATDQIEQLVQAHPDSPKQVSRWLNQLAGLQIKLGADLDTVRHTLQSIIDLYPDHAVADTARNRLDHLRLEFKGKEKSQAVTLGSYEQNIGLKRKR